MKISGKLRRPREDEIRLMKLLASAPHALDFGPVGRCSSRGWIRHVGFDERSRGIYELTPLGQAWLEGHASGARASDDDDRRAPELAPQIAHMKVAGHDSALAAENERAPAARPCREHRSAPPSATLKSP